MTQPTPTYYPNRLALAVATALREHAAHVADEAVQSDDLILGRHDFRYEDLAANVAERWSDVDVLKALTSYGAAVRGWPREWVR